MATDPDGLAPRPGSMNSILADLGQQEMYNSERHQQAREAAVELQSQFLSMGTGGASDVVSAATGRDIITAREMSGTERVLAGSLPFLPVIGGAIGAAIRPVARLTLDVIPANGVSIVRQLTLRADELAGLAQRNRGDWHFTGTTDQLAETHRFIASTMRDFENGGGLIRSTTHLLWSNGQLAHGRINIVAGLPEILLARTQSLGTFVEELYHYRQIMWRLRSGQSWEGIAHNPMLVEQMEATARVYLRSLGFTRW